MYRTSPQAQLRKSSLDLPALGEPCQLCANWNVLDATWVCPVTGLTTVHAEMEYQFGEAGPHKTMQMAVGDGTAQSSAESVTTDSLLQRGHIVQLIDRTHTAA